MASKQFELANVGIITIIKRASSRSIRLSIRSGNQVMVSIPRWATYRSGLAFAQSKAEWLQANLSKPVLLANGQAIGKLHTLRLLPTHGLRGPRTLVSAQSVTVRYPHTLSADDPTVQKAAATACIRALRVQATQLLPDRLSELAAQHDFTYSQVSIKQLKGRWGSCDNQQRIVLNLYLMQLPWHCIDYVLLHELTHTKILRHGPPFWSHMQTLIPSLSFVRQQMRSQQPVLHSADQIVQ